MDMKQYPAKRRNHKHQSKINSGAKMNTIQNPQDEVKDILNKSNDEKQALIEYAGLVAAFETEVKRVLGKAAPETADEAMLMCTDTKCKEAMDALNKAYFAFVEGFGYSPEFACTGMVDIPNIHAMSAIHMGGNFKPKMEESNMTEVKEAVEKVAEATNEAVESAADAVTDTVDSAKVVAIEAIEEADETVETVTTKVEETVEAVKAETGEEVSIDLVIEEAPKKRELSDEEKAHIKAEAEAKAKADVERLTEEARRSQNPFTAAYDFITKPFKS